MGRGRNWNVGYGLRVERCEQAAAGVAIQVLGFHALIDKDTTNGWRRSGQLPAVMGQLISGTASPVVRVRGGSTDQRSGELRLRRTGRRFQFGSMTLRETETVDLPTPTGPMRTYIFRPAAPGRYPGILLYSEIFQVTGPIRRTAALLAGHGFVVAVPEIYHEFEPAGTVLAYDQAGADRGNALKTTKELASYDADARAVLAFLKGAPYCTGRLGTLGICIGGHLAFRAAMNPEVLAATCFYATDIHKRGLGRGMNDNSLDRIPEIQGELLMIWGRQDPHVPLEGRLKVHAVLDAAGTRFTWHEFNGAHAFLRDEGHRYDPELALQSYGLALALFRRKLGEGDLLESAGAGAGETRH